MDIPYRAITLGHGLQGYNILGHTRRPLHCGGDRGFFLAKVLAVPCSIQQVLKASGGKATESLWVMSDHYVANSW